MFACVYTHKLSLDLAIPKRPGHNSFLHLNKRGSRGILIAPIPLPRLFFLVGRDYSILIFYSTSSFSLNHHYPCIPIYSFRTTFAMDFIDPINNPRVSHCYARLNGSNYRMAARQLPLLTHPTDQRLQTISSVFPQQDTKRQSSWYNKSRYSAIPLSRRH